MPVTVFGHPLDEACEEWAAEQVLEEIGLSYLAEKWSLETPEGTVRVVITEASPERLVLASADFHHVVGADIGTPYVLRVPEGKTAKNLVHLDLRAAPGLEGAERMAALEAEAERLVGRGASVIQRHEPRPPMSGGHIVMLDPEGNEFCLD